MVDLSKSQAAVQAAHQASIDAVRSGGDPTAHAKARQGAAQAVQSQAGAHVESMQQEADRLKQGVNPYQKRVDPNSTDAARQRTGDQIRKFGDMMGAANPVNILKKLKSGLGG